MQDHTKSESKLTALELALAYAAKGIPAFPCDPKTKRPYLASKRDAAGRKIPKSGGFYDATTDRETIIKWWTQHPDAMIGIPTGQASGFWVVDVDYDPEKGIDGLLEWKKLQDQYGTVPVTGSVATPRGGTHYYLKTEPGVVIKNSASSIAPGIDIRGEGGYIIAAGSVRSDGSRYEVLHPLDDCAPMPPWLRASATKRGGAKPKDRTTYVPRQKAANSNVNIDEEIAKVASTTTGSRNDALNRCAFVLGKAGLDLSDATERLTAACRENGLLAEDGEQAVTDTITRAFADGQAAAASDPDDDAGEAEAEKHIERLNKDYFVASYGSDVLVCSIEKDETGRMAPVYRSFQAFERLHSNVLVWRRGKPIKLGKFWLEHPNRRQYVGVSFVPNGPDILPGNIKNLWLGFAVKPKQGDCNLILKHILEVLANGDVALANYILNYLAWTVQNPDKPAEVVLIFKGSEGTGKGLLGRLIMDLFGSASMHISSSRHLVGNFNAHLDCTVVLFADEAFWAGDKAARGAFFALITEPYITVERKGIDAKQVINRLHIIIATNEDWVVPAEYDSRRYAVFEVSGKYKQKAEYFKPIYEQIEQGGREALLFDLLHRDIGYFHPRQIIKTNAFRDQVIHSMGPLDAFWLHLIEEGHLPVHDGDAPKNVMYTHSVGHIDGILDQLRRSDHRLKHTTDRQMAKFLREKGCTTWHGYRRRGWRLPPLAQARADWEKNYGKWDWPNDNEDWETYPESAF